MNLFRFHSLKSLAFGLAGVYLGAGILSTVESVLHPHVVCLEHGELVHLEDRDGSQPVRDGRSSGEFRQALIASSAVGGASHPAHEHCPNTGFRRSAKGALTEHSQVEKSASIRATVQEAPGLFRRSIPIYRLAPNHSPPHRTLSV
jgi:hypothetical protein